MYVPSPTLDLWYSASHLERLPWDFLFVRSWTRIIPVWGEQANLVVFLDEKGPLTEETRIYIFYAAVPDCNLPFA